MAEKLRLVFNNSPDSSSAATVASLPVDVSIRTIRSWGICNAGTVSNCVLKVHTVQVFYITSTDAGEALGETAARMTLSGSKS
jgi:hypothetical protein